MLQQFCNITSFYYFKVDLVNSALDLITTEEEGKANNSPSHALDTTGGLLTKSRLSNILFGLVAVFGHIFQQHKLFPL